MTHRTGVPVCPEGFRLARTSCVSFGPWRGDISRPSEAGNRGARDVSRASAAEIGPRARRESRVLRQWRTPLLRHVQRQRLALLSLHGGRHARTVASTQGGGADVQHAFVGLLVR